MIDHAKIQRTSLKTDSISQKHKARLRDFLNGLYHFFSMQIKHQYLRTSRGFL